MKHLFFSTKQFLPILLLSLVSFQIKAQDSGCWSHEVEQIERTDCNSNAIFEWTIKVECEGVHRVYLQKRDTNSKTGEDYWRDVNSKAFNKNYKVWEYKSSGLKIGVAQNYRLICVTEGSKKKDFRDSEWSYVTLTPIRKCKD